MVDIELNGITYENVPETLDEVSLELYLKLDQIREDFEKEDMDEFNRLMMTYKMWSVVIGCPVEDLEDLKPTDIAPLAEFLSYLNIHPNKTIKTEFIIEGEKWRSRNKFTELNTGEIITIQSIIGDKFSVSKAPLILAVMIRKDINGQIEKLDTNILEERANILKKLSINEVWGLLINFWNGEVNSSPIIPTSSLKIKKK